MLVNYRINITARTGTRSSSKLHGGQCLANSNMTPDISQFRRPPMVNLKSGPKVLGADDQEPARMDQLVIAAGRLH